MQAQEEKLAKEAQKAQGERSHTEARRHGGMEPQMTQMDADKED